MEIEIKSREKLDQMMASGEWSAIVTQSEIYLTGGEGKPTYRYKIPTTEHPTEWETRINSGI